MITPKFEDPYDREDSGSQYFEKEYSKGKSYSEEQDYSDDEQPKDRVYSEDEGEVYEKGFESESDGNYY